MKRDRLTSFIGNYMLNYLIELINIRLQRIRENRKKDNQKRKKKEELFGEVCISFLSYYAYKLLI